METVTGNNSLPDKLGKLLQSSREYVESRVELEVLKGTDKIAQGMSVITTFVMAMVLGMITLIFAGFGCAVLINESMRSSYAGYFIVAAVIVLIVLVIFIFGRARIKKAVINTILNNIDND